VRVRGTVRAGVSVQVTVPTVLRALPRTLLPTVLSALLLAGCGSGALTTQPSVDDQTRPPVAPSASPSDAFNSAVTKLRLIAQDSCQTDPPAQVYPNCERFLAELRSAAGTIQNNAPGLPGGVPMGRTAAAVLAGVAAYDKDGCGAAPDSSGGAVQACTADLTRVRQGVSALINQTANTAGG
jgi:hypothetical protein